MHVSLLESRRPMNSVVLPLLVSIMFLPITTSVEAAEGAKRGCPPLRVNRSYSQTALTYNLSLNLRCLPGNWDAPVLTTAHLARKDDHGETLRGKGKRCGPSAPRCSLRISHKHVNPEYARYELWWRAWSSSGDRDWLTGRHIKVWCTTIGLVTKCRKKPFVALSP